MVEKVQKICDRVITYSFYLLFALVPLAFSPFNHELFEFNKMWLTYILTIVIMASWLIKMVLRGEIKIQRTPLDILIALFLISQVISTIFSIDVHTSLWGYYSRFNGGLLSIISYILLYYALVSNFTAEMVKRLLFISLVTGALVAFYGVLEHFGIDKDYWVQDVQNRVFSTLGQPNWLAAYLSILVPLSIALGLTSLKPPTSLKAKIETGKWMLASSLFYLTILFTKSRSGFAGVWLALILFIGTYFFLERKNWWQKLEPKIFILKYWYLLVVLVFIGSITFVVGSPFDQLNKFTLKGLTQGPARIAKPSVAGGTALEAGGTESGEIRKIVWQGAIDIAKHYPLFGSGVETFAYSYFQYRPVEHNLTSEWDFLYNKAHNEYLNYLATTGIFGLGSYLLMIGAFLWLSFKYLKSKSLEIGKLALRDPFGMWKLEIALISAYLSILVSNFFGFSVVIINLFFFLIPAFVFVINGLNTAQSFVFPIKKVKRWISVLVILIISYFLLLNLVLFWLADKDYASGLSLSRSGQYEKAYKNLFEAVRKRGDEPTFKDELALNAASLATAFYTQDLATTSGQFTNQAITLSNQIVKNHPNNVTFWKSRARLFYTLSGVDEVYLTNTIDALEQAQKLAPTDPKITYNLALLYQQTDKKDKGIKTLEETLKLKPNFRDARYALGIFYDDGGDRQKAIEQMEHIIKNIASTDAEATQKLLEWRGY